jgi:hypothetical protein
MLLELLNVTLLLFWDFLVRMSLFNVLSLIEQMNGEVHASFANGDFRPLDVLYTAHLCIFENMHESKMEFFGNVGRQLRHTLASDEELWELFT